MLHRQRRCPLKSQQEGGSARIIRLRSKSPRLETHAQRSPSETNQHCRNARKNASTHLSNTSCGNQNSFLINECFSAFNFMFSAVSSVPNWVKSAENALDIGPWSPDIKNRINVSPRKTASFSWQKNRFSTGMSILENRGHAIMSVLHGLQWDCQKPIVRFKNLENTFHLWEKLNLIERTKKNNNKRKKLYFSFELKERKNTCRNGPLNARSYTPARYTNVSPLEECLFYFEPIIIVQSVSTTMKYLIQMRELVVLNEYSYTVTSLKCYPLSEWHQKMLWLNTFE